MGRREKLRISRIANLFIVWCQCSILWNHNSKYRRLAHTEASHKMVNIVWRYFVWEWTSFHKSRLYWNRGKPRIFKKLNFPETASLGQTGTTKTCDFFFKNIIKKWVSSNIFWERCVPFTHTSLRLFILRKLQYALNNKKTLTVWLTKKMKQKENGTWDR